MSSKYQKRHKSKNRKDESGSSSIEARNESSNESSDQKKLDSEKDRVIQLRLKYHSERFSLRHLYNLSGLRAGVNEPIGRNWSTYYCLKKKMGRNPDTVMVLINEFLNWLPAQAWNPSRENKCIFCECPMWGMQQYVPIYTITGEAPPMNYVDQYNVIWAAKGQIIVKEYYHLFQKEAGNLFFFSTCSLSCHEKYSRESVEDYFYDFMDFMKTLMDHPERIHGGQIDQFVNGTPDKELKDYIRKNCPEEALRWLV